MTFKINPYTILAEKLLLKRTIGIQRNKWEDNIKMNLGEI
jgi:hypothetical protein